MRRRTAINSIVKYLSDKDICLFCGRSLCLYGYQTEYPVSYYIYDVNGVALSIGLGIAINTNKRVFCFIDDSELLYNIDIIQQIGVSKLKNIFIIVVKSGRYMDDGKHPTIFDSISSPRGIFLNSGFIVHDYTKYINNKNFKTMSNVLSRIVGPLVIFVSTDNYYDFDYDVFLSIPFTDINKSFVDKIVDKETALFDPPFIDNVGVD